MNQSCDVEKRKGPYLTCDFEIKDLEYRLLLIESTHKFKLVHVSFKPEVIIF